MKNIFLSIFVLALMILANSAFCNEIDYAGFIVEYDDETGSFSVRLNGEKIISKAHYSSGFGKRRDCDVETPDDQTMIITGKNGSVRKISITKEGELSKCVITFDLNASIKVKSAATVEIWLTDFLENSKMTLHAEAKNVNYNIAAAKGKDEEKVNLYQKIKDNKYIYKCDLKDQWHEKYLKRMPLTRFDLKTAYQGKIIFDFERKNSKNIKAKSLVDTFLFQTNPLGPKRSQLARGFSLNPSDKKFLSVTIIAKEKEDSDE